MVPVHRKQRILCLCSWLPAGAALTGSLAATITSCVAQGTGIRPPPRGENTNFKKKNHRTTQEDEKYRQVGKDESHLTLRRHDCAGAGRAPRIPRGIPLHPALSGLPPCGERRDNDQRSPPCRSCWIHDPGTAGTSVLLLSPEQLWPQSGSSPAPWGGGRGGPTAAVSLLPVRDWRWDQRRRRVGVHGAGAGVRRHSQSIPGGTALLFPRGDHARSRQQEIQTTLIF